MELSKNNGNRHRINVVSGHDNSICQTVIINILLGFIALIPIMVMGYLIATK
jgi:hypothetical protein